MIPSIFGSKVITNIINLLLVKINSSFECYISGTKVLLFVICDSIYPIVADTLPNLISVFIGTAILKYK